MILFINQLSNSSIHSEKVINQGTVSNVDARRNCEASLARSLQRAYIDRIASQMQIRGIWTQIVRQHIR
jgi:hypothetical protein